MVSTLITQIEPEINYLPKCANNNSANLFADYFVSGSVGSVPWQDEVIGL